MGATYEDVLAFITATEDSAVLDFITKMAESRSNDLFFVRNRNVKTFIPIGSTVSFTTRGRSSRKVSGRVVKKNPRTIAVRESFPSGARSILWRVDPGFIETINSTPVAEFIAARRTPV